MKKERCDVPLSCFVSEALSKDVYRFARLQRVAVSAFMRDALARYVENCKIAQQKQRSQRIDTDTSLQP